jgi:hypothetical protein
LNILKRVPVETYPDFPLVPDEPVVPEDPCDPLVPSAPLLPALPPAPQAPLNKSITYIFPQILTPFKLNVIFFTKFF